MNKIYGYFKGNLGDDLMLQQLLDNIGPQQCDIVLGKSNYLIEQYKCNRVSNYKSVFTDQYDTFIFVGGSTIQLPPKFTSLMNLFHIKMLLTFILLKLKRRKIVYWNTNLYAGKRYNLLLKAYLLFIDEMYVRDQFSASILDNNRFKNYRLIRDLVEELPVASSNERDAIGISLTETQSIAYITAKVDYIISKVGNNQPMIYIEFQKTANREQIIKLLKTNFTNIEIVLYESRITSVEQFSRLKYMFCDRFHSIVLANLYDVPADHSSYDSKATNYLNTPASAKCSNISLYPRFAGDTNE